MRCVASPGFAAGGTEDRDVVAPVSLHRRMQIVAGASIAVGHRDRLRAVVLPRARHRHRADQRRDAARRHPLVRGGRRRGPRCAGDRDRPRPEPAVDRVLRRRRRLDSDRRRATARRSWQRRDRPRVVRRRQPPRCPALARALRSRRRRAAARSRLAVHVGGPRRGTGRDVRVARRPRRSRLAAAVSLPEPGVLLVPVALGPRHRRRLRVRRLRARRARWQLRLASAARSRRQPGGRGRAPAGSVRAVVGSLGDTRRRR